MKNRVQEIQEWLEKTKHADFGGIRPSNAARNHFDWLIIEIKQARVENLELLKEMISVDDCQSRIYKQVKRVEKAEARIRDLEAQLQKEKQV